MSMPIGFKNSTDGTVEIAIDACKAAKSGHCFLSVGREGLSSIVETAGNPDVHIILRGGGKGPNYEESYVSEFSAKLGKAGLRQKIMVSSRTEYKESDKLTSFQIDCSHGNSQKQHRRQIEVADNIVCSRKTRYRGC